MAEDKNWRKSAIRAGRGGDRFTVPPGNTPLIDSPGAIVSRAHGPQAQVVQVETLGKAGLIIVLVMFVVISGAVGVAAYALGVGEARAESAAADLRRLNAKVEVLQYDLQDLRAKTGNAHENQESSP